MNNKGCLFISHAEKDNDIVRILVDLLYDIGISEDSMLCSSISEIGIPINDDIYNYLRDELNSDGIIPIFVLSENYYKSIACLNEMGAVWVKQKDYYIFLIPPFDFSDIRGTINPNKKGILLDYTSENELYKLKDSLNQFKTQLQNIFDLAERKNWERKRDGFIAKIHNLNNNKRIINGDIDKCENFHIGTYDRNACQARYDNTKNEEENELYNFDKEQVNLTFNVCKKHSYYNILRKEKLNLLWSCLFEICGQAFLEQKRSYVFKEKVTNYVLDNNMLCIRDDESVILSDESFTKISVNFIAMGLLEIIHPNMDNDYNMIQETQYRITNEGFKYLTNLIKKE